MSEEEGHPVISGIAALIAVGVTVGLLVSLGALAGTSLLGLGGDEDGSGSASEQVMYLPTPSPTEDSGGPQITLAPGEETPTPTETVPVVPEFPIALSSSVTEVGPMENIYLTGVYAGGEGKVIQVQRLEDGTWEDFPVDASVSGGTFSTYVQTAQSGDNTFRVRDSSGPDVSNEVLVAVR